MQQHDVYYYYYTLLFLRPTSIMNTLKYADYSYVIKMPSIIAKYVHFSCQDVMFPIWYVCLSCVIFAYLKRDKLAAIVLRMSSASRPQRDWTFPNAWRVLYILSFVNHWVVAGSSCKELSLQ